MPNSENLNSGNHRLFIDYIPAELKQTQNGDWRVVYYYKIPGQEKMKRFRKRVPPIKNKKERHRLAMLMCENINAELRKGWNPLTDFVGQSQYKRFDIILNQFIAQAERRIKDGTIRKDTLRSYHSFIKIIQNYMKQRKLEDMLVVDFNRAFIIDFVDYIYFEKKRTARTSNNYLAFFNTLGVFLQDRKYLIENPAAKIPRRKESKKKREVLPSWLRSDIINYYKERNPAYLTLCLTTYFCFIRRTELTKLKVKFVDLEAGTIFIPGDASKNSKDGVVTIPKMFKKYLSKHIDGANGEDFLFSKNNFKPGAEALSPKKISDEWAKMRVEMKLKNVYQFYSLKDTGITNLLLLGVPAKKVRDQARHHDIRITESYVARNDKADEELQKIDFKF